MSLFSMIAAAQNGTAISLMSKQAGVHSLQTANAIRQFLPILIQGIETNFAHRGGLSSLLQTLDQGNYIQYYNDPNIYTNPYIRHCGIAIMDRVIGSDHAKQKILNHIYFSTGVPVNALQFILPFVTIIALSALYRKAQLAAAPANNNILPPPSNRPYNNVSQQHAQVASLSQPCFEQNAVGHDVHHIPQTYLQKTSTPPMNNRLEHRPTSSSGEAFINHQAQDVFEERLPNVIVQAQEAYAKRLRDQKFRPENFAPQNTHTHQSAPKNGQNSLEPKLRVKKQKPHAVASQLETHHTALPQIFDQHAAVQEKQFASISSTQAPRQNYEAHPNPGFIAPRASEDLFFNDHPSHAPILRRKYASLKQKLASELPWYT